MVEQGERQTTEGTDEAAQPWTPPLVVIGARKLVLLHVATFGAYGGYWLYKHWRQYKYHVDRRIWPVARAVLGFFYVTSLFKWLDECARQRGQIPSWRPTQQAVIWIILLLAARFADGLDRHGTSPLWTGVSIALLLASVLPLLAAQRVANTAEGDPAGVGNAKLSTLNWGVVAVGASLWALAGWGYLAAESDKTRDENRMESDTPFGD
jgi:hypothetical protein